MPAKSEASAHRSAADGRAPMSRKWRLARRSTCSGQGGFAATSLDDLSAATGMNRPSLYGAFGDKRELYIKSYQRYRDDARAAMIEIFRERDADPRSGSRGSMRWRSTSISPARRARAAASR